jgi:hypothetical protein
MKITRKTLMVNFETEVKLGNNDAIELTLEHNAFIYESKSGDIEVDEAQINVYETMEHITACLEEFVVEEDETGHTLPGFEEGIGLDNLNIRFQEGKQGI